MDLKRRLENKLEEIADFLLNFEYRNTEIGALEGLSGNAMFHFYYSDYKDDDRHREKGSEIIFETLKRIQEGYNHSSFCYGISGAMWILELLKEEKYIDFDERIISKQVDHYLFDKMKGFIKEDNFDFLHGAIGIGHYFLKRYQNLEDNKTSNRYKKYLSYLLKKMEEKAVKKDGMIYWILKNESEEHSFLGLAHGVSGYVNFLSRLLKYPNFRKQAIKLIQPACKYILDKEHSNLELSSSFPNSVITTEQQSNQFNSRLAWCHGDLGIGISLLRVGQLLKDTSLIKKANNILIKTSYRKDPEEASIVDAGLCHGAFGVSNIYYQIYRKTNNSIFLKSSEHWLNTSLKLAIHNDGYAGYKEYEKNLWKPNHNFLGGISGMGLVIIDFLRNTNSKWNESLMID